MAKEGQKIRAIIKRPDERGHVSWISNTLENLQRAVDGYIETVSLSGGIVIICNEEGRLRGMEPNCCIAGVDFVGTICLVGRDGEEFDDCPLSLPDFRRLIEWEAIKA